MEYQVTCLCGNKFSVGEGQVGKHVACPACNRALIPVGAVAGVAPAAGGGAVTPSEAMKRCPFCGEAILAIARKCRYCNEFLDRAAPGAGGGAPAAAAGATEGVPVVFDLAVSQWDNFFRYVICVLIVLVLGFAYFELGRLKPDWKLRIEPYATWTVLGVDLLVAFSAYTFYLAAHNSRCVIRANRIETTVGTFTKQTDSIEMFRVTDVELKQSLLERMLGIGTVRIKSNDPITPLLELYEIPQARKVFRYVQEQGPKADLQRNTLHIQP